MPMNDDERRALAAQLKAIEEGLLDPAVRADPDRVQTALADGFVEFGASGEVFDRAAIVAALMAESNPPARRLESFRLREAGADFALTTCRVARADGGETLRSTVWRRHADGRWQMAFHQGTSAGAVDEGTS